MVITDLNELLLPSFYNAFTELMHEGYGQFPPKLQDYFLSHDYTINNFKVYIARNFRKVLLAVDENNDVIGFLIGDHTYGGVAFISWLGVLKDKRNNGIGKELLNKYVEYARSLNAHLIELYTYEAVKGFYEKFGFVEVGRREQGFFGQKNLILNLKVKDYDINILV
jgi:ribosomal protein S18 acetylase RimI-like enzyme